MSPLLSRSGSLLMLALPSTMAIAATPGLRALQVLPALPALLVLPMLPATRSLQALLSLPACRPYRQCWQYFYAAQTGYARIAFNTVIGDHRPKAAMPVLLAMLANDATSRCSQLAHGVGLAQQPSFLAFLALLAKPGFQLLPATLAQYLLVACNGHSGPRVLRATLPSYEQRASIAKSPHSGTQSRSHDPRSAFARCVVISEPIGSRPGRGGRFFAVRTLAGAHQAGGRVRPTWALHTKQLVPSLS